MAFHSEIQSIPASRRRSPFAVEKAMRGASTAHSHPKPRASVRHAVSVHTLKRLARQKAADTVTRPHFDWALPQATPQPLRRGRKLSRLGAAVIIGGPVVLWLVPVAAVLLLL
jgi:hypothetical protein